MANSLLMMYGSATDFANTTNLSILGAGVQNFFTIGSGSFPNTQSATAEVGQQLPYSQGTMTNLWMRVTTGTASGSSTVQLRVNGANGNQTFSIAQATTGAFTDAVNNDGINSGDLVCVGVTPGDTNLVWSIIAVTFASHSTANAVTKVFGSPQSNRNEGVNTYFITPIGCVDANNAGSTWSTSEAQTKNRQRKAMSVNNAAVYSSRTTPNATLTSRINGVSKAITFTMNAVNNLAQDTTHTDNLSVGDDYNYQVVKNSGGSIQENSCSMAFSADFTSTNGDCIFSCSNDALTTFSTSVTKYFGLSGSLGSGDTTEINTRVKVNSAFQFSELTINISSNTISNTSTLNLRAGGSNAGSVAVSIGGNVTGIHSDSIDTYTAATTDLMNYQLITGSTGTSMIVSHISVWGNATSAGPAGGPTYQHFGAPAVVGGQDYRSFGSQMTIFGY